MSDQPAWFSGIRRVLGSAKVALTAKAAAVLWIAAKYASAAIEPAQRAWLWIAFMGGVVLMVRSCIDAWAAEDAAAKAAPSTLAIGPNATATSNPTPTAAAETPAPASPAAARNPYGHK